jgi:hypothetical protein
MSHPWTPPFGVAGFCGPTRMLVFVGFVTVLPSMALRTPTGITHHGDGEDKSLTKNASGPAFDSSRNDVRATGPVSSATNSGQLRMVNHAA